MFFLVLTSVSASLAHAIPPRREPTPPEKWQDWQSVSMATGTTMSRRPREAPVSAFSARMRIIG